MIKTIPKKNLKIFFLIFIIGFLFAAIFIGTKKTNQAEAQNKPYVNCRKQVQFTLPSITTFDFGPNELEIPIGETVDMTESMAYQILIESQRIIDASTIQMDAGSRLVLLASQCSADRCQSGCNETTSADCEWQCGSHVCDCGCCDPPVCSRNDCGCSTCPDYCWGTKYTCQQKPCSGKACPFGDIENTIQIIRSQQTIITNSYNAIDRYFRARNERIIGWWWEVCPAEPLPQNPLCRTMYEHILDYLQKSRSGDYEYFVFNPLNPIAWNHEPAGLKDCVMRPSDIPAALRGEKSAHFLFSCKEAIMLGYLDKDTCYGNSICFNAPDSICPHAENYYCCEYNQ